MCFSQVSQREFQKLILNRMEKRGTGREGKREEKAKAEEAKATGTLRPATSSAAIHFYFLSVHVFFILRTFFFSENLLFLEGVSGPLRGRSGRP